MPDGFSFGKSDSGWMTGPTFFEYIANVLYPEMIQNGVTFPVLVLMDGHKSHINLHLHEFCVEKKILLFCLLPNTTHILQPCDIGIFRPLKIEWRKVVQEHKQTTTKSITKVNFATIFNRAYVNSMKTDIIKNAFKACGLFPFNPNAIDYTKCISERRKEIEFTSSDDIDVNKNSLVLNSIEEQIPQDLKDLFEEAYANNQTPERETVLFSIWKKLKYNQGNTDSINHNIDEGNNADVVQVKTNLNNNNNDISITDLCTNDLQEKATTDNEYDYPFSTSQKTNPNLRAVESTVTHDKLFLSDDIQVIDLTKLSVIDINHEPEVNGNDIFVDEDNEGIFNVQDLFVDLETKTVSDIQSVDCIDVEVKDPMPGVKALSETTQMSASNVSVKPKSSKPVGILGKHLHYPKVEKPIRTRNTEQVYAITSSNWKKAQMEKMKAIEEQEKEKQRKKEERLEKKKLKEQLEKEKQLRKQERLMIQQIKKEKAIEKKNIHSKAKKITK